MGISAAIPCVAEDFLAGYHRKIDRGRNKEHRIGNTVTVQKKSSKIQGMVAENSHVIVSCFMQPGPDGQDIEMDYNSCFRASSKKSISTAMVCILFAN